MPRFSHVDAPQDGCASIIFAGGSMRHVSILLYPQAMTSSVSLTREILHATNEQLRLRRRRALEMQIQFVGLGAATAMGGMVLTPDAVPADVAKTDLIILPALWRDPLAIIRRERALLDWVVRQWQNGCRLCAVGSASFLLAEAGMLRDQPATTHWYYFDRFARRYPDTVLKRDHLVTKAGRIYCVGSVNTLVDLMVQLVAESFGRPLAATVEQQFSPEIRQSVEVRLFDLERNNAHVDDDIIDAQHWLRRHYAEPVSMSELAARTGLRIRSFNRRFKLACGVTPGDFLQQTRIDQAKILLRDTNLKVAEIAVQVGYANAGHFAAVFQRWSSATPRLYRQQVRRKLFSPTGY